MITSISKTSFRKLLGVYTNHSVLWKINCDLTRKKIVSRVARCTSHDIFDDVWVSSLVKDEGPLKKKSEAGAA